MYLVKVYPDSDSPYVSQIYAGLYELSAAGSIQLRLSKTFNHQFVKYEHYLSSLHMEITDSESQQSCRVFFDLVDGARTFSMADLDQTDIYFKRTYDEAFIDTFSKSLREKILPFGLHYSCRSTHETPMRLMHRLFLYNSIHRTFFSNPMKAFRQVVGRPLQLLTVGFLLKKPIFSQPLLLSDFEVGPSEACETKIYFRTRVYDLDRAQSDYSFKEWKKANTVRVETIRALKSHFGKDFIGGLRDTDFSRKNFPDCIFPVNINMAKHIEYSRRFLINVNTDGLHGSVGWKLPECLAASRCIVSEPIRVKLPTPLMEGRHYLAFTNPEECVSACERLMNDTQISTSMRRNNYTYYHDHVKPSKLVHKCLQTAFSKFEKAEASRKP